MEPEINKIIVEATERVRKETEGQATKQQACSGNFSSREIIEYVSGVSIEEVMALEKELVRI